MSFTKRAATSAAAALAPRVTEVAPNATAAFVHQALVKAISGVGPFPSAALAAEKQMSEKPGDIKHGIHDVIENHVRYAGVQGFVTNLGGLITLAVAVPANVVGLALIQCRMVAGILHLRGYDLDDPRVRDAILACLLGEEKVLQMLKKHEIPGTPVEIATNLTHDPNLDNLLANEVAAELIGRAAGKRAATVVARRVPVVGGVVVAGTDAYITWRIGRYVDREFLPRKRR